MKEQLIEYKTGKLAKEKGFFIEEIKILDCEDGSIQAFGDGIDKKEYLSGELKDLSGEIVFIQCTQSFLQKWLREKREIIVVAYPIMFTHNDIPLSQEFKDIEYSFKLFVNGVEEFINRDDIFDQFEKALEKGLFEALKLIKI